MLSRRRIPLRTPSILVALAAGALVTACASGRQPGESGEGHEPGERVEEGAGAAARTLTPRERAAMRVTKVTLSPDSVDLTVGDSVRVVAAALDSAGKAVQNAPLRVFVSGEAAAWEDSAGYVIGREPGVATLYAVVQVPSRPERRAGGVPTMGLEPPIPPAQEPGRAAGPLEKTVMARATIRVRPLAPARVELESVPDTLYAGTRARLSAAAYSKLRQPTRAAIAWSSSDTAVVSVSEFGLARARKTGTATITASAGPARASRNVAVVQNPVRGLTLQPSATTVRTGDVVQLEAAALDARGQRVAGAPVDWSVLGPSGSMDRGAYLDDSGAFVAERPGLYTVVASVGDRVAAAEVSATPRPTPIPMDVVGHAAVRGHATTGLIVFEGVDGHDYAYTGTHAGGAGGNVMYAWDVTDPSKPVLTDSVVVDARVINHIAVNDTRQVAVLTREGASDGKNGIVLLDTRIPAHPKVFTSYTEGLTGGVHDAQISGGLVYVVDDGTRALRIIDISDPNHPREVGRWQIDDPGRYLQGVTIKNGLAYLSYWNDGLVILDVGAGVAGGTATDPKEVSRYTYRTRLGGEEYGNTHQAVRYGNYVFVADEIYGCPVCLNGPRGFVHVLDVSDIRHPKEVAWFRVPEAGAHDLWAQDGRLYVAYHQGGLRVVDISGELRGDLYRQGREIGWFDSASPAGFRPNAAMAWAPQVFKGHIFLSDMDSGLWIVKFARGDATTGAGTRSGGP